MAKLMWIAGIVLVAVGVALGLMIFFSPASIVSWGLTPEAAAIIIVGGIVSVGLGGVINAIETQPRMAPSLAAADNEARAASLAPAAAIPEFGRRFSEPATVAAAAAAVAAETVSPAVKETIEALEQAKADIQQALGDEAPEEAIFSHEVSVVAVAAAPEPEAEPAAEPEAEEDVAEAETAEDEEPAEDGQLYVVEERTIRNKPARILSDGTVEAETDEGWMRFENLEHLDEYLEATVSQA